MALLAPFLMLLLLGGAQVGEIAYSQVSLDSAAREGARAGVEVPNQALSFVTTLGSPYNCKAADFVAPGNPICVAVLQGRGYLSQNAFTTNPCTAGQACVTIAVRNTLSDRIVPMPSARLTATSPCNSGKYATINGTVTGIPASPPGQFATITDTSGDTVTGVTGPYTLCATANSLVTGQDITAQVGPVTCGGPGYSGSISLNVAPGQIINSADIAVDPEPACPTSTPSPSPTPTPTDTPTPGTPGPTAIPTTGPTVRCPENQVVPDTDYISVTVSYPTPIFVPIVGAVFQTAPGLRQISTTVTFAIEPCSMTPGI